MIITILMLALVSFLLGLGLGYNIAFEDRKAIERIKQQLKENRHD